MTEEHWDLLRPAALWFHPDFETGGRSARDILAAHARGLAEWERPEFYAALAAMLDEYPDDGSFAEAFATVSSGSSPWRWEVEDFLNWAESPQGQAEIAGPG